jgi:hypothetical protein
MNQIIRYGVGRAARGAAMRRADELWAGGQPARALFKPRFGGWVVVVDRTGAAR